MARRSYILWILILAGWILIGLTWTLNYYFFADHYVAIFTVHPTLRQMLVWELPYWVLWAGLSPAVLFSIPIAHLPVFESSLVVQHLTSAILVRHDVCGFPGTRPSGVRP